MQHSTIALVKYVYTLHYTVILSQSLLVSGKYSGRLSIFFSRLLSIKYNVTSVIKRDGRICGEKKKGNLL